MARGREGLCIVGDCRRPLRSAIHCGMHHSRISRHGSVELKHLPLSEFCLIPDCARPPHARSMCSHHYNQARHGLSVEQMLSERLGCSLCFRTGIRLCVDHDHNCCPGEYSCGLCFRGFLCVFCNQRLSAVEDPEFQSRAMVYLWRDRVG